MEEEGDAIAAAAAGSSPPPPPSVGTETLSTGSIDDPGLHKTVEPDGCSSESVVVLTDELKEKIIRQVEYYFSDENLPTDKFLLKHVKKDKEGFVPVAVLASFRKMKKLVQNKSLIVTALRESSQLILNSDGKRVRRIHPLPVTETRDTKACTVLVENLPEDCSTENLQKIFGDVGNVRSISIRDPRAMEGSTKACKAEKPISGKIHALVEYETAKEAEKAVAGLKDVQSWRNGMRVELLLKWTDKYGVAKNVWKGGVSEKNDNVSAYHAAGNVHANHIAGSEQNVKSVDTHETPEQEEAKAGRNKRNRGRGRGQSSGHNQHSHNQHNVNGHGHGSPPTSRPELVRKPPPGPRMPDGTRGFTVGRGRPPISNHNQEE